MAETQAPTTREYDFKSLVVKADSEHYKKDVAYEFSNGRTFKSTDGDSGSGIYE